MFTDAEILDVLKRLQVSDVVWLPDSALGPWEAALESAGTPRLIRVCREGEAWTLAAGLHLGGRQPLVMIQNTGLFESGDAMRNVLFDLRLPLSALIGYRSYLVPGSPDTARKFTEPVLAAWGIEPLLVDREGMHDAAVEHWQKCRQSNRPGVVLLAEGRM